MSARVMPDDLHPDGQKPVAGRRCQQKVSGSIGPALTPASRGALGYLLAQPVAGHHHAICGQGALLFWSQWARAGAWPVRAAANRRISVCGRCGADQAVHRGGGRDRESCCCCMDATHVELFLHAAWICRTALGRYPPIAVRGSSLAAPGNQDAGHRNRGPEFSVATARADDTSAPHQWCPHGGWAEVRTSRRLS